ncbi:xanthine/uracil permease family protein-like protein [Mollisia scopiformis]|uniref:Xanthine/uracil permease family protein-like protein n=1 Tax=Mollisia scopiformis TaxID=149040 RepID=A0A194XNX6_MOLSC|nr:xanthine/uracil permease family protein-like protein [Mollisia scopiformis]KUJ21432.1 xanthine/uracil permease family protein-like protein [Mollisia scopiformis]
MSSFKNAVGALDERISKSTFGRVFRLDGSGHPKERKGSKFVTEIRAGLTTFFTMAYIIAVNANILSQSGGTCVCPGTNPNDTMCNVDPDYNQCLLAVNRDLITATAAISGISSIAFGFLTNLPVALAPGMGLNAYFTYQVVGYHGTGSVSYQLALTAVFVEGFVFVFLSLIGMRQWLVKVIPSSVKVASGVGIGMFLTEIGMSYSGIGLITGAVDTPTDIGGCPPQYLDPGSGACTSHKMTNPTLWIGVICGGVLTSYLMAYRVKSAIMIGITVVSIMSWPRDTTFTYFPHTAEGDEMFAFFKKVVDFHPITHILAVQDWDVRGAGSHFALALFTFLYVDIVDATATLYSMARFSGVVDPETGDFPRSTLAYCTDAISISIGSLFGCSPVTAFIESGAGITEGGRTGLTAITTGTCFLISIFFAPIFASIPPWATGCTLILVGCMMMRQVTAVNWSFIGDALPAFVTIVSMPFTYSVAYGLIAGLFTYTILNGLIYITKKVSGGRIQPPDADLKEYWTYKPGLSQSLPWFVRVVEQRRWFTGRDGVYVEAEEGREGSLGASEKELVEGVNTGRKEKGKGVVVVGERFA